MSPEIWKPIPGFPNYEASSIGRIRRSAPSKGTQAGKVRRLFKNKRGYLALQVSHGGLVRALSAHVAVATAFHGPRPDGFHTSHIDGNRTNNVPENLCYETPQANYDRKEGHGTIVRGEALWAAKLTAKDVLQIRARFAAGRVTRRAIAADYNVAPQTIEDIISGRTWASVQEAA